MPKFMEIDLLENLEKIMKQNTKSYQSDFEIDREILINAAKNAGAAALRDRTYLWMSRACGTWCVKEKNVFLEPAYEHQVWEYYAGETSQKILAYAVEVMGIEDKKVVGNLYPLDYRKHAGFVKAASIPADWIRLVYEKGERIQNREKRICRDDDKILGKFQYSEYVPNDIGALESALCQEENERRKMQTGKIENYIRKLVAS